MHTNLEIAVFLFAREHEELVDNYILELLAYFIESLAIAHIDEPVIGLKISF